ncbi:MAG TPA: hypothetical protein VGB15_23200 [Longimicrobium sp.]|jgi:hypothetical protein
MASEPAFKIDDRDGFTVHIPSGLDRESISRFLDFLVLERARMESELTEEEAAAIAKEIDHAVWEQVRSSFEEA